MASMTRRQLFRGGFKTGRHGAAETVGDEQPLPQSASRMADGLGAIAGDFPPEMLSMEAQRLGLDPDSTDRETLLKAVYEVMAGSGPRSTGQ
jgi:hypothetical protein